MQINSVKCLFVIKNFKNTIIIDSHFNPLLSQKSCRKKYSETHAAFKPLFAHPWHLSTSQVTTFNDKFKNCCSNQPPKIC